MAASIYTRTGDSGDTSLADGSRVPKTAPRVEAYGTVDEANSWVGFARSFVTDSMLDGCLEFLQHRLYNCSSNLAVPPGASLATPSIQPGDVDFLERAIDRFEQTSGEIKGFVLPGGCRQAGLLHLARTVCRRAERCLLELAEDEPVDTQVRKFINRASDFLFAAARYANAVRGTGDVCWDQNLKAPDFTPRTGGAQG